MKFYVDIPCTIVQTWSVEAETAEEAKELVASGDGTFCSNDSVPFQDADSNNWRVFVPGQENAERDRETTSS